MHALRVDGLIIVAWEDFKTWIYILWTGTKVLYLDVGWSVCFSF